MTVEGLMGHVNWTQKASESLLAEYTGVDHRSVDLGSHQLSHLNGATTPSSASHTYIRTLSSVRFRTHETVSLKNAIQFYLSITRSCIALHDLSPFCFRTPRSPLDQSKP